MKKQKEIIEKQNLEIDNLKDLLKQREKIITKSEKEKSLLEEEKNIILNGIKNENKENINQEIKKIKKSLIKTMGDNLKIFKDKYNDLYKNKEIELNKKIEEIINDMETDKKNFE